MQDKTVDETVQGSASAPRNDTSGGTASAPPGSESCRGSVRAPSGGDTGGSVRAPSDAKREIASAEAGTSKKIASFINDANALAVFSVPQLKQYCRDHELRGYSGLTKDELIRFIMSGGRIKTEPQSANHVQSAPAPVPVTYAAHDEDDSGLWWLAGFVIVGLAILVGCAVGLYDSLEWYQWQHVIGSVGGLLLFFGSGLILIGIGWFFDEVIVTTCDGGIIGFPITFLLFAVPNSVLSFLFWEQYSIIFYWISGYLLVAGVLDAIVSFKDDDIVCGVMGVIGAVAVAAVLMTRCFMAYAQFMEWYQLQHVIGSFGGLALCVLTFLAAMGVGWIFDEVPSLSFEGIELSLPIVTLLVSVANFVLTFFFWSVYWIIFIWFSGFLSLLIGMFAIEEFSDDEPGVGGFAVCVLIATIAVMVIRLTTGF